VRPCRSPPIPSLVVTVLQPRLTLLLVLLFGLDAADLVVSLIAVAALGLPDVRRGDLVRPS
jgi:hypothetical protein